MSDSLLAAAASTANPEIASIPVGTPQPSLIAVFSRKIHGGLGPFDLAINSHQLIGGAVTVEPRRNGAAHTVVFQFDSTISMPGNLTVVDDVAAEIPGAMATASSNEIAVTLPTISDNKRIHISITSVNGSALNVSTSLGFLLGDATNLGAITASSVTAIKARSGQVVDIDNFRYDIDASGLVSAADIGAVKARQGRVLTPPPGPPWLGFAGDARHTAVSSIATQPLSRIRWSSPVDLSPQYSGSILSAHYGPPVITARNTVVLPVKIGASGGFKFEARSGANGVLLWSIFSDYVLPAHNWIPSYNVTLTTANRVYAPGAGGRVYYRDNADSVTGVVQSFVFYGDSVYAAAPSAYDSTVFINTPITADALGNIFFGYSVTGSNPANLVSGIVRIAPNGTSSRIELAGAMGTAFAQPMLNSAPALSADQGTLFVAVRTASASPGVQTGHLVALNSTTLALNARMQLIDPATGANAVVTDNATSSPTIGPDGDVYFGLLRATGGGHQYKGWMLHFDATLTTTKTPGAFGWDNTPSIVAAGMVPSYTGPSAYLLMTKYNSYTDGQHRLAILDPNQTQLDTSSGATVMKEILTMLSTTPDPGNPSRVTEWCVNTAAVDPFSRSVLVNNEDGYLYRWDLVTNQLSERIQLNGGVGQAYTATVIGPDGAVYAVNNAVLSSVGR